MVEIIENEVTLKEWINAMSDIYEFGFVYSVVMPVYLKVFKRLRHEIESFRHTRYVVDGETWDVYDSKWLKTVTGDDRRYNHIFNKIDGTCVRFGRTLDEKDDPVWCKLGPELLDLEISVNGCPKIGGRNCAFCYKNNTDVPPTNMTFDEFKNIVGKFPRTLCQIPLGITGVKTNPDLEKMLRYAKDELWIPPTLTLSGKDMDSHMADVLAECCAGCAVSCYDGEKELCYRTISELNSRNKDLHVNMHLVLGNATMDHCMDVLDDIQDGLVPSCCNVVFLSLKPKGRAKNLDCSLSMDNVRKIVGFCKANNIHFGFDTCHANAIKEALGEAGYSRPEHFCEPCESSKFSSYVNVRGEYHHCSFAEGLVPDPTRVSDFGGVSDFIEWWRNDPGIAKLRHPEHPRSSSCQFFDLGVL